MIYENPNLTLYQTEHTAELDKKFNHASERDSGCLLKGEWDSIAELILKKAEEAGHFVAVDVNDLDPNVDESDPDEYGYNKNQALRMVKAGHLCSEIVDDRQLVSPSANMCYLLYLSFQGSDEQSRALLLAFGKRDT